MTGFIQKFGIDQLSVEQRLTLIEEIWESIDAERSGSLLPSKLQLAEFEARLLDDALNDEAEDLFEISKQH